MLILVAAILFGLSFAVNAADEQSTNVRATVGKNPPTRPAKITFPFEDQLLRQTFTSNAINVVGLCSVDTLVLIYSNNILIGSDFCGSNGGFSVAATLFTGPNALVARSIDILGQEAPDSLTVNVYYDNPLLSPQAKGGAITDLMLEGDQKYIGYQIGDEISIPIRVSGGKAPYAINISWGDGTSEVVSRSEPDVFSFKHRYDKAGSGSRHNYTIIVSASDASGQSRKLQLTTIVSDKAGVVAALKTPSGRISLAWPIWGAALILLVTFWAGELNEKRKLRHQNSGVQV